MASGPTEPTAVPDEFQEELDEDDEDDVYDEEGEEYQQEEDEDGEGDEEVGEAEPETLTALLLGNQNGAPRADVDDEEDDEEDDDYHDDEGTEENPINLESPVAGSKRPANDFAQGEYDDDVDDEAEGQSAAKKARV